MTDDQVSVDEVAPDQIAADGVAPDRIAADESARDESAPSDRRPTAPGVADADPVSAASVVAQDAADRMWAADVASQRLGMELLEVGPGHARMRMRIRADMLNGHGIAHGGFVFALADSAFAFACNSYGAATVAAQCDISYLTAVQLGDELVAEAVERARYRRSGIYDVTVRRAADDVVVAEFRGCSRTLRSAPA